MSQRDYEMVNTYQAQPNAFRSYNKQPSSLYQHSAPPKAVYNSALAMKYKNTPYKKSYKKTYARKPGYKTSYKTFGRKRTGYSSSLTHLRPSTFGGGFKVHDYNGYYHVKASQSYSAYAQSTTLGQFYIAWGNVGSNVSGSTAYVNNEVDFAKFGLLFKEWKMNGMAYKCLPLSNLAAAGGSTAATTTAATFEIESASFVDQASIATSQTENILSSQLDYKAYGFTTPHQRYYNLSKYYGSRSQEFLPTVNSDAPVYYTPGYTCVAGNFAGLNAGAQWAIIKVSWYVTFRGLGLKGQ